MAEVIGSILAREPISYSTNGNENCSRFKVTMRTRLEGVIDLIRIHLVPTDYLHALTDHQVPHIFRLPRRRAASERISVI
jgi:hypothetical protein